MTILASATHVHLNLIGTATETETETETATETMTGAMKDVKERRALLANAAEPTDLDSKPLFFVFLYIWDKEKPRIQAGLHTSLMYYDFRNQYLFFFPILFLYLFLRWLKIVSLRGFAFLMTFFTSLSSPKTISAASTSKINAATISMFRQNQSIACPSKNPSSFYPFSLQ